MGLARKALVIAALISAAIALADLHSAFADPASAEADSVMSDRCAVCHGENGNGQGPAAQNMNPRPRDFHDRKWQKSVSNETLAKAIVYGGQAVGVSASMPANPDLAGQTSLVDAMVQRIRAWGR